MATADHWKFRGHSHKDFNVPWICAIQGTFLLQK